MPAWFVRTSFLCVQCLAFASMPLCCHAGRAHHSSRQHNVPHSMHAASPFGFGFSGFGMNHGMFHGLNNGFHDDIFSGGLMSSSFSSSFGGGGPGMTMSSTSSSYINGKQVTTSRTVQNGVETVIVKENGEVVSHKVNGKETAERLEYRPANGASSSIADYASHGESSRKRSRRK
ncbi:hypothetical protein EB796_014804 [Bugula neritina]|uniref:Secreted protein n=1 Tax=Bugula neritina TaxID=10212 RepID=A0A7J7JLI3_BUGNE|nr:hypothetical protein EB796_014804 [Bugula neritina]